jgi:D-alanyl-D-alanine carboxypeptidase
MSFYVDVIRNSANFNSPNRVADLAMLEPITRAAVQAIVAGARQQDINLMVYETYRSEQRQQELFRQGATKLQAVGVHHYGLACDLVKSVNGEPNWKGDFSFLKGLGEANGLIWGGDWGNGSVIHSFVDADHVQRINVADQGRLFNLSWYPEDAYRPQIK